MARSSLRRRILHFRNKVEPMNADLISVLVMVALCIAAPVEISEQTPAAV
jgi:hypothetical protein